MGQMFYRTHSGTIVPLAPGPKGDPGELVQADLDRALADYLTLTAASELEDRVVDQMPVILSGTEAPPDPTGLPDGAIYFRRNP